jgi:TPR repeat protein
LIVWFTQEDCEGEQTMISPWLLQDSRKDDVADFVLASAISSASESGFDPDVLERELKDYPSEIELYLRSAERGNTFALCLMGSLIEEKALDDSLLHKATRVLDKLCDASSLPEPLRKISQIGGKKESFLAMRFWFEGALRGNPLAQRALADELMVYASESGEEGARILAAVLFGLAGQQGDEEASKALSRVVEFDLASRNVKDEQGFLASPVVQTAKAALS